MSMIGIAIVALLLGGLAISRRRTAFWVQSVNHAKLEEQFRNNIVEVTRVATARPEFAESLEKDISYHKRRVAYHAALRVKYERAMRRPWELTPPDPPPPPVP
jgi:hypothetical protein